MIASSKAEPKVARESLKVLSEFTVAPSLDKYKELVKLAIKNIYLWTEKNANNLVLLEERINNLFESFKSLITEYHEKIIKNQEGLAEEIIAAIKDPNELVDFVEDEEDMHPEMKIINKLCQTGFNPEFSYLGSSKLACMPCHFSVMVLNETRFGGNLEALIQTE